MTDTLSRDNRCSDRTMIDTLLIEIFNEVNTFSDRTRIDDLLRDIQCSDRTTIDTLLMEIFNEVNTFECKLSSCTMLKLTVLMLMIRTQMP